MLDCGCDVLLVYQSHLACALWIYIVEGAQRSHWLRFMRLDDVHVYALRALLLSAMLGPVFPDLVLMLRLAFPFRLSMLNYWSDRLVICWFLLYFRGITRCLLQVGRVIIWCMRPRLEFLDRNDAASGRLLLVGAVVALVALTAAAQVVKSLFMFEARLLWCLQ